MTSAARRRMHIDWHPVDSLAFDDTAGDTQLTGRGCRLFGWSFQESTGTDPASILLVDGSDAAGTLIVPISLDPGQSTRDWLGYPGIRCRSGIFLAIGSGSVFGSIWPLLLSEEEIAQMSGLD